MSFMDIPYGCVNIVWDSASATTTLSIGGYGERVLSWDTVQAISSPDVATRGRGVIFLIEEAVKLMEEDGSVDTRPWSYQDYDDHPSRF